MQRNIQYILLLLFTTVIKLSFTQNISGRWIGGHSYSTKITLDLLQIKDSVSGIGLVEFNDKLGKANVYIEGIFKKGIFEYETKRILEEDLDSNYVLCFVAGKESLKIKKKKNILEGACISIDQKEECFNLSAIEKYTKKEGFNFRKKDFLNRQVLVIDTINTTQQELELQVWDNMKEDGDIVTIYLNEEIILENYTLQHELKSIKINCKNGLNEIIFYAHNLGSEPPNTATISIKQNEKTIKTIDIKSDENKSESFIIFKH